MKRAVAVCGAVAMMFVAVSVSAMGKPDFSGKWTIDAEKTAAAMPAGAPAGGGGGGRMGGGGAPGPMTITQTATELKIETTAGDGTVNGFTYKLDGSEQTRPMGQIEAKVKATVVGSTVTIATTTDRGNGPTTTTAVYSMDGAHMVIATTRPGRQGGEPTTNKVFYKKVS
jgi:hypothetical protein